MILRRLWTGAEGGTRTPTSYLTRPSNVRVYQFRHFGSSYQTAIIASIVAVKNLRSSGRHINKLFGSFRAHKLLSAHFGLVAGDAVAGRRLGSCGGRGCLWSRRLHW